jgi:hypothetical protein
VDQSDETKTDDVDEITKEDRHTAVLFVSPDIRDYQDLSIVKPAENENKNIPEKIKTHVAGKRNYALNMTDPTGAVISLEINFSV